jgi:transcriptional regulator GlxA family with amidase domain
VFLHRESSPYDVLPIGARAGRVRSQDGLELVLEHGLESLADADTVVVTGPVRPDEPQLPEVLDAVRAAAEEGTRIASICAGTFTLAAAGLLDGKRATTHWSIADELARQYPRVHVDPNVLFVDEGQVLTSAGSAAGMDLCLHLVRKDFGVRAANAVARELVAAPYRSGGQVQYIPRDRTEEGGDLYARTRQWALEHLAEDLTLADLASHAGVSVRTFSRRFTEDTGRSPMKWLMRARVDTARELLETTDLGVDRIADLVGLGSGTNLRLHFRRILDTTPGQYRRTFTGRDVEG